MEPNMQEMAKKVDKIYFALMGSDITQDGGLVKRVIEMELEQIELRRDIEKWKDAYEEKLDVVIATQTKMRIYISLLWTAAGIIIGGILATLISKLK